MRYNRKLNKYTSDEGLVYSEGAQVLLQASFPEKLAMHPKLVKILFPILYPLVFVVLVSIGTLGGALVAFQEYSKKGLGEYITIIKLWKKL